jgi:hypothetical protein
LIDPSAATLMAAAVMHYVETQGSIAPKLEGRIATYKP